VQCLFDGNEWFAMTATNPKFPMELIQTALEKHWTSVDYFDPVHNYFFWLDEPSNSVFVKRIISRANWSRVYEHPFIEKLRIP
jgi:hypothetical protein